MYQGNSPRLLQEFWVNRNIPFKSWSFSNPIFKKAGLQMFPFQIATVHHDMNFNLFTGWPPPSIRSPLKIVILSTAKNRFVSAKGWTCRAAVAGRVALPLWPALLPRRTVTRESSVACNHSSKRSSWWLNRLILEADLFIRHLFRIRWLALVVTGVTVYSILKYKGQM